MDVRKGGAWRPIVKGEALVNGVWRTLKRGEAYVNGEWRQIFGSTAPNNPLTLSISPTASAVLGVGAVATRTFTATPTNGLAPYTYQWAIDNALGTTTINRPTAANTTLSAVLGEEDDFTADFHCTVTDSLGRTATAYATAHFIYLDRTDRN